MEELGSSELVLNRPLVKIRLVCSTLPVISRYRCLDMLIYRSLKIWLWRSEKKYLEVFTFDEIRNTREKRGVSLVGTCGRRWTSPGR